MDHPQERPQPPRPDMIRQIGGSTFGWIDHRFRWFWEDLNREEILLYFLLVTTADAQSCSWWSTRKITKVLKIGPATLIRAKRMLEERKLIATRTDPLSKRTIYQILPLPIEENVRVEIPIKHKPVQQPDDKNTAVFNAQPSEEQKILNERHLAKIKEMLDGRF